MSEQNFRPDFTVNSEGFVVGNPPCMYEYGERYVKCRKCNVSRPGYKMVIWHDVPVCDDHIVFRRPSELSGEVPEVRQLQVEVHLPSRPDRSFANQTDAPVCKNCGDVTVRSGTCHKCMNCGQTSGCS